MTNRGWVLVLLAGCAGDPSEPTETESEAPPPAQDPGACELTSSVPIGWTEPALGATPADLFASATGAFFGELALSEGAVPVALEVDPDLGELLLVTRAWVGEGEPADCVSTVEASFAARFWTEDASVDVTFSSVLSADGHRVSFLAGLPPPSPAWADATSEAEVALTGALDPEGVWSGWLTWGADPGSAAWFEVAAAR